jgi:hypothetical protein
MESEGLEEGASNGVAGKGGVLVGTQGRKGKGKALNSVNENEEEFSWD